MLGHFIVVGIGYIAKVSRFSDLIGLMNTVVIVFVRIYSLNVGYIPNFENIVCAIHFM